MAVEPCQECGATGRWGLCSELFMVLLARDHERRQPWAEHHAVNVACYLLQHPSRAAEEVLAGQWQVVSTFLAQELDGVHAFTRNAARASRGGEMRHAHPPAPQVIALPRATIEDVALDGTFPAPGYEERMAGWARATVESRCSES